MFKVLERLLHDKIATEAISLSGSARFRGKLSGKCPADALAACAKACPVGAFQCQGEEYTVDYRRCLFCGRCVVACAEAANAPEGLLSHTADEAMPYLVEKAQQVTADVIRQKLGRSLHVRHLDAGSCNACDFEMGAMSNPIYDLHRYGVHFDASPRHADMLMVTGTVTRNLEEALRMSYEALPEPKLVMACGACAAGGETYGASYAIVGAADKVVPVDIYVPGCPPRPSAMIAGLLAAADLLAEKL
ncbi:NADH-quinone oxidoreductase subunit NuoB [Selenomonas caprae]|uniref:NADH-quinone oxidoreductase subunit NuoB n=1 Tax=Selenomonas caprae TaxID=2606905 RepID=A0A5D6WKL9_9FIRM|nr:NADH-quinone oxidoreductase subunit NuoB [Selenomonas caprae]TYZ26974.1 NADH-quinone oxidoreductase subunit NuoB [Selenomonas caprae]